MSHQFTPRSRRVVTSVLATAALSVAVPLVSLTTASAAVLNDPPANGHSIIVFPQRDFVHGDGFALNANLRVEIWRGAVEVGVSDPFVNSDTAAGFDLNHLGAPCWASVTPDIIPNDMVQVVNLDSGEIDRTVTANVIVTQKAAAGAGNTVVIKGTAAQADGTQIPVAQLDSRIVASTASPFSDGTRSIRTQPVYDTATGNSWTATFSQTKNGAPLTAADVSLAVASESRGMWLGRLVGLAVPPETTIYEAGAVGGPAAGCNAPSASDAVTGSAPSAVNVAAVQAGGNLQLSGTSYNAANGTVSLSDGVTATPLTAPVALNPGAASTDPAVALPGTQTWTATIPMADVAASLADGTLTARVSFTRVLSTTHTDTATGAQVRDTGTIAGASRTLLKDVVAPQPPTASVPGGTYYDPQSVTLNPADPARDTIRYTIANPTAPDPTQFSTLASGPIQVTSTQQLKAVSFDPAGNPSTVMTSNYVIATRSAPGAPTAVSAVGGDSSATVSWTAPVSDGGSPITTYHVDVFQGGLLTSLGQNAGTATSWTIGSLTNGTSYQFTVQAVNGIGSSPRSAPTTAVTPRAVPGAPTAVSAIGGDASASVSWTAPSNDGGATITNYHVNVLKAGVVQPLLGQDTGTATARTITGLSNGVAYQFSAIAQNSVGSSASSAASTAVTPMAVPGAPTAVSAVPGNATARVSWTAPASTGGSPITNYHVNVLQGGVVQPGLGQDAGTLRAWTVSGLTNGVAYQFSVVAQNSVGSSPSSAASTAVTPVAVPGAPTAVTAVPGNATARVTWTAPASTGGSPITNYHVDVFQAGVMQPGLGQDAGTATAWTVTGLTNGVAYRFTVIAQNSVGSSPRSVASAVVTPTAPDTVAPTITARAPAVNATKRSQTTTVTATFSEAVTGVTTTTFTLRNTATGVGVAATVTRNGTTNQWILTPSTSLAANTRYTATLTGGAASIRDLAGNALTSSTWSFATGPGPTLLSRSPGVNALNVNRVSNVVVTFSESVLGVSTTTFVLRDSATNAAITAVLTRTAGTNTWTLNPSATLAANKNYTVVLTGSSTAIRDAAGNPLAVPNWSFTTGP